MTLRRLRARQPRLALVLRARLPRNIDKLRLSTRSGLICWNLLTWWVAVGIETSGRWTGTATGGTRTGAIRKGTPAERIRIYVVGIHNDYLALVQSR
jgi:hypothetical protein